MTIKENREKETLTLMISGRLDSSTAPQLEEALKDKLIGITKLIIDFSALDYMASAGIRVLIKAYKDMNSQRGKFIIRDANEEIIDVLTITGFIDKVITERT